MDTASFMLWTEKQNDGDEMIKDKTVSKTLSELKYCKIEKKYCFGIDQQYANKAYNKALRKYNKLLCMAW